MCLSCHCFQRVLNRYHLSSQTLHTFMDTFQGGFKDGTNGTRDCRYFAAVYLIVRVALYISLGISIATFNFSMINGVLLLFGLLLVMFHPYKKSLYNKIDISLVFIMMAHQLPFFQRVAAHQQTEASLPQQVLNEATALLKNN